MAAMLGLLAEWLRGSEALCQASGMVRCAKKVIVDKQYGLRCQVETCQTIGGTNHGFALNDQAEAKINRGLSPIALTLYRDRPYYWINQV